MRSGDATFCPASKLSDLYLKNGMIKSDQTGVGAVQYRSNVTNTANLLNRGYLITDQYVSDKYLKTDYVTAAELTELRTNVRKVATYLVADPYVDRDWVAQHIVGYPNMNRNNVDVAAANVALPASNVLRTEFLAGTDLLVTQTFADYNYARFDDIQGGVQIWLFWVRIKS